MDDQGTEWRRKIAEDFNRLSRVHERYRRQTGGRAIAYNERGREFMFANNQTIIKAIIRQPYPWPLWIR